ARARGGTGQIVVSKVSELSAALEGIDETEIEKDALVVEENLTDVATLSVGLADVGGITISYYGTQNLTLDNNGASVYGGSRLFVVRGEFQTLLQSNPEENVRLAIHQARQFEAAVSELFPDVFASRRNYDVVQGLNARGTWCSGVLEQSWRIGGATGAELL